MIPVFYINLTERKDRDEYIFNVLKNAGMEKVIRIDAINGRKLPEKVAQSMMEKADFKNTSFALPALGCFMTHSLIWQYILDNNIDKALILEDDIGLIDRFKDKLEELIKNLPYSAEIVSIGLPQFEKVLDINQQTSDMFDKIFIRKVNDHVRVLHPDINPGTLGYIITKRGAENILKSIDTTGITCSVDSYINAYLETKNIRYASTVTLVTTVEKFGSDISGVLPIIVPAN